MGKFLSWINYAEVFLKTEFLKEILLYQLYGPGGVDL